MTLSMRIETSHKFSFSSPLRYMFKVMLVPERLGTAKGFHYIVLLDTSGSMTGYKIDVAKQGASALLSRIPEGNKVTFITFSDTVKVIKEAVDPQSAEDLSSITASGQTALYTALLNANKIAKAHEMPTYVLLLTDGNPTDQTNVDVFSSIQFMRDLQIVAFGIGDDYNEVLLKTLADKTNGLFYHISEPNEIAEKLPKKAVTEIAAKNVSVDIVTEGSGTKLLNYSSLPVKVNAVENVVKILGETEMPANYSGTFLTVKVQYEDPVSGKHEALLTPVNVSPATNQQTFISGVNNDLISEYRYYELLNRYAKEVQGEELVEATRTLTQLNQVAQQTRRIEFIETTRRLSNELETTKRLGSTEQTRRLSKEVSSEVTRKLREG
ncbi:vWA domain-containing protein [Sulfuracidifex tepidarius]|uniref:VWFA domain-containing protein n=1 Tax=Sulfuracidifex tepidarius TaxID=1294262 RepID=A0A510E1B2_9CREN|nr:VWA domain-containing protein [Sulfuracidifex tepidarius]BBG23527.1 hypothetical protein IC006_0811 [Sulfuracidifex tepidarius]BBG26281.1 hypothetical protein IC007_0786 [Sulfuracidifex tepidarius]